MNRRKLLAVGLLAVLVGVAGCVGFGDDVDEERLRADADYDWETDATATFRMDNDSYRAVYEIENGSAVEVYQRDALGSEHVVQVSAVQFRYPNGTVVGADSIDVAVEDSRVVVTPPTERGLLAYTARSDAKSLAVPVAVAGSHEVVLVPGMRVDTVLFGDVSPPGYESRIVDDRVHLRWDDLDEGTIVVRAYLGRDLYIFGGVVAAVAVVGVLGFLYYRLQIRRLERAREEAGLNVEAGEDDSGGRPPFR